MAKLPSIKRIAREDLQDAPAWIDRLLGPLNQFMETVYYALDRQLSFDENIACSTRSLSFRTPSGYGTPPLADNFTEISTASGFPVSAKVRGVIILSIHERANMDTVITEPVCLDWTELNGQIKIRYVTGLAALTEYVLTVLIV